MQDKKSFILYKDSLVIIEEMTDEQAGLLFKAINDYQNGIDPKLDFGLRMAFTPFKNQFVRDNEKWEEKAAVNRENGKKGGRPTITQPNPENPDGLEETQMPPEKGVSVNVTDTVNVTVKVKDINIPEYIVFSSYALEKKPLVDLDDLKLKYDSWIENDWKDGNDKEIVNWKTKLLNTLPFIKEKKGSGEKKESKFSILNQQIDDLTNPK